MTRASTFVSIVAAVATWGTNSALAQNIPPEHNFRLGFALNRDQPVKIDGIPNEVGAGGKFARYAGNARIVLGDITIRSRHLVIYFADKDTPEDGRAATPTPFGTQGIHKITAYQVFIETKKQSASADILIIDWRANSARLSGNILLRYGQNILRADSLRENMKTGEAQVTPLHSRNEPLGDYWTPDELRRIMRR